MGQLTALFYKNSLILVRQKSVCVFQVAAAEQFLLPIIGLIVVAVAKNVYQTMYRPDPTIQALPKILYETHNSSIRLLLEERAPYAAMQSCEKVATPQSDRRVLLLQAVQRIHRRVLQKRAQTHPCQFFHFLQWESEPCLEEVARRQLRRPKQQTHPRHLLPQQD